MKKQHNTHTERNCIQRKEVCAARSGKRQTQNGLTTPSCAFFYDTIISCARVYKKVLNRNTVNSVQDFRHDTDSFAAQASRVTRFRFPSHIV